MAFATLDGVTICYETFGNPADPPVLLVMGLAAQMTAWDVAFCKRLAVRGFSVVRFDNRDCGLSTVEPGPDGTIALYSLDDMADDAIGLMDALGLDRVHVVGASMGGMIAQLLAIHHVDRVRSLTSIMANPGDGTSGQPHPSVMAALSGPAPNPSDRAALVDRLVAVERAIESPAYPLRDRQLRALVERSIERSYDPEGAGRQYLALAAAGDRTAALKEVSVPTLVIHGADDPLVDVSGGRATAAAVPGAELLVIDGMGHDLPFPKWDEMIDAIVRVARAGAS